MKLCVIEGDAVGHEVVPAAIRVLKLLIPQVQVIHAEAGYECLEKYGTPLPESTIEKARACQAVLFGAVESPAYPVPGYFSPIVRLRQILMTYANIRPIRYLPVPTARPGVDMIVVRENTEDLYVGDEFTEDGGDRSTAQKVITRAATERVAHAAYRLARRTEREKVTIVHKANILPQSDGLFRRVALEIAEQYPDIETDELLIDTAAYWMVKEPTRFDVILTPNMYGDILSDMAAAWGGGLGLAPALNLGDQSAIAEPVHGSSSDIAGKGIVNPTATILSVALLLRHFSNRHDLAQQIEQAVRATYDSGGHTFDVYMDGAISTEAFTDLVCDQLGKLIR
ncbi:MAG: isocitrate/isopropylmalate dehydrogenase family protein [Anaerolineae bacterium]|jgi:homoisocitrate dehydrogenase|nr:isocitrate/isopropylmalate dehydrogenase family protein [Anaerolineae bacterium]